MSPTLPEVLRVRCDALRAALDRTTDPDRRAIYAAELADTERALTDLRRERDDRVGAILDAEAGWGLW